MFHLEILDVLAIKSGKKMYMPISLKIVFEKVILKKVKVEK
jgi:hypothetical protein